MSNLLCWCRVVRDHCLQKLFHYKSKLACISSFSLIREENKTLSSVLTSMANRYLCSNKIYHLFYFILIVNEDYDLLLQGLVLQSLHSIYERAGRGLRTRRRTQLLQFRINIHGIQAVWVGNVYIFNSVIHCCLFFALYGSCGRNPLDVSFSIFILLRFFL